MGMQRFIRASIRLRKEVRNQEIKQHGKDKCPDCGRHKSEWFRDKFFETLQCMCGKKFYDE